VFATRSIRLLFCFRDIDTSAPDRYASCQCKYIIRGNNKRQQQPKKNKNADCRIFHIREINMRREQRKKTTSLRSVCTGCSKTIGKSRTGRRCKGVSGSAICTNLLYRVHISESSSFSVIVPRSGSILLIRLLLSLYVPANYCSGDGGSETSRLKTWFSQ
jgi:hypothetical protein